jgi:hypothetical protein
LGDVGNFSGGNICNLKSLKWKHIMAFPVGITDAENLVVVQKLCHQPNLK